MLRNFMLSNVTFTVLNSIHFLANDTLATALQLPLCVYLPCQIQIWAASTLCNCLNVKFLLA